MSTPTNTLDPDCDEHATVTAATIKVEGVRDAAKLATAGDREAAKLKEQGRREETVLLTGSQRRINLIWEVTQAVVTIMVVGATLFIAGSLVLKGDPNAAAFLLLSNAFFMIVTSYYQRTNHTRTGGMGGQSVDTDR